MYNAHQAHTSAKCQFPAKGHVKEATFLNMCGGNNCMHHNKKERAIFQYVPCDKEKDGKRKQKNTPEKIKETMNKTEWQWGNPRNISDANHVSKSVNNKLTMPDTLGPSTQHNFIVDTGCTWHFLTISAPYKNKTKTKDSIRVQLPNQDTKQAMHTAELDLPNLPVATWAAHIFPDLGTTSLLLAGQLCDANCMAMFTDTNVTIKHNGNTILTGTRNKMHNLWQVTLNQHKNTNKTTQQQDTNKIEQSAQCQSNTKSSRLVAFAHGAFFSPAFSTLQQALAKNYINNFPGLSEQTLCQHPPWSVAMVKGHLDQSRQNQWSTKPKVTFEEITNMSEDTQEIPNEYWPNSDTDNKKTPVFCCLHWRLNNGQNIHRLNQSFHLTRECQKHTALHLIWLWQQLHTCQTNQKQVCSQNPLSLQNCPTTLNQSWIKTQTLVPRQRMLDPLCQVNDITRNRFSISTCRTTQM